MWLSPLTTKKTVVAVDYYAGSAGNAKMLAPLRSQDVFGCFQLSRLFVEQVKNACYPVFRSVLIRSRGPASAMLR